MNISHSMPRIYVACLAAYNNCYLHGAWIDVTDVETLKTEIQAMLAKSPITNAEEWAIHDYEGFESLSLGEFESLDDVVAYAEFIKEHGELGAELYNYYGDLDSAVTALEDDYHGEHDSEEDFARQLFDDCYAHELPKQLSYYIDYEKFSHDLFISDYLSIECGGKTHVFASH